MIKKDTEERGLKRNCYENLVKFRDRLLISLLTLTEFKQSPSIPPEIIRKSMFF